MQSESYPALVGRRRIKLVRGVVIDDIRRLGVGVQESEGILLFCTAFRIASRGLWGEKIEEERFYSKFRCFATCWVERKLQNEQIRRSIIEKSPL